MLEKIKLTKSTRVQKDTSGDHVLLAVPENKVKAGKPVIMGGWRNEIK